MSVSDGTTPESARVALFQSGDFTLASGQKASWKIECDALTPDDWVGLAAMLMDYLPEPFGWVLGVPRGGAPLADALKDYRSDQSDNTLIVDDVWTTGGSMQRFIDQHAHQFDTHALLRAVIFARNPVPDGVTALFSVPAGGPHIYTVDSYLVGPAVAPCVICGRGRAHHREANK